MIQEMSSNVMMEPGAGLNAAGNFSEQDLSMIKQALSKTKTEHAGPSKVTKLRLAVQEMMESPNFKASYCNFDYIHAFKPVKKSSASDTSVFFGDVAILPPPPVGHSNDVSVSVKVALKEISPNNSLTIERVNYQQIANKIILNEWSPHIVAYVASFGCPVESIDLMSDTAVQDNIVDDLFNVSQDMLEKKQQLQELEQNVIEDQIALDTGEISEHLYNRLTEENETLMRELKDEIKYDTNNLDFLVTEKAINAKTLEKWIKTNPEVKQFKSVLFQILYTFEVFNRLGFRHNDCHLENVLIEDLTDSAVPESSTYVIDGINFNLPTKSNFVKIFDFDRSSFSCDPNTIHPDYKDLIFAYQKELKQRGLLENCINNVIVGYLCENYGQCNGINRKYDTMLTLTGILDVVSTSQEKTIYNWIFEQIKGAIPHLNPPGGKWLKYGYTPTDEEMPSTLQMLKSDFFNEFRSDAKLEQVYRMPKKPLNYP